MMSKRKAIPVELPNVFLEATAEAAAFREREKVLAQQEARYERIADEWKNLYASSWTKDRSHRVSYVAWQSACTSRLLKFGQFAIKEGIASNVADIDADSWARRTGHDPRACAVVATLLRLAVANQPDELRQAVDILPPTQESSVLWNYVLYGDVPLEIYDPAQAARDTARLVQLTHEADIEAGKLPRKLQRNLKWYAEFNREPPPFKTIKAFAEHHGVDRSTMSYALDMAEEHLQNNQVQ